MIYLYKNYQSEILIKHLKKFWKVYVDFKN